MKNKPSQAIAHRATPVRLAVLIALLSTVLALNAFFAFSPGDGGTGIGGTGRIGGDSGIGGTGGPGFKLGALSDEHEERAAPATDHAPRDGGPERIPGRAEAIRVAVEDLRLTPVPGHATHRPAFQRAISAREELDRTLAELNGEFHGRELNAVRTELLRDTIRDPVDNLNVERGLDNQLARDKDKAARDVLVSTLEVARRLIVAEADAHLVPDDEPSASEERVRISLPTRPERPDRPSVPSRRFTPPQRDVPSPPVRPMQI